MSVLTSEFEEIVDENHAHRDFMVATLVQIYLHRQADPETMVGVLSPKHGDPQQVADLLMLACEEDYIDFDPHGAGEGKPRFILKYEVSEDIVAMLDRYQYPLPMVIEPKKVKGYFDTGYVTINRPTILNGSDYFKDKDLCADHLDRANSVALTLEMGVIGAGEAQYTTPERAVGESFTDFSKRQRQARIFYDTSVEVMEGLMSFSDKLWITHRYDRRGRCYGSGYHVNTQGTDYNKAVLNLAKKEIVDVR
jgi:hypothetical protein